MISLSPNEGRRTEYIDDSVRKRRNKSLAENVHVAHQHDQLYTCSLDHLDLIGLLLKLVFSRDRDVSERDAKRAGNPLRLAVVADNQSNLRSELAGLMPEQEIRHSADSFARNLESVQFPLGPGQENTRVNVSMLVKVEEVASVAKHEVGDSRQIPDLEERLQPEWGARRLKNYLKTLNMELTTLARAYGKSNVHHLEREDLVALTVEEAPAGFRENEIRKRLRADPTGQSPAWLSQAHVSPWRRHGSLVPVTSYKFSHQRPA